MLRGTRLILLCLCLAQGSVLTLTLPERTRRSTEAGRGYQPGLGRAIKLGDLYDAKRDQVISGVSFWDYSVIEDNKITIPVKKSDIHIMAEEDSSNKMSRFNLDAGLQLSVISGLLKVDGSAKYLNDDKKFDNSERLAGYYDFTHHVDTIQYAKMYGIRKYHDLICEQYPEATHIVHSVKYGLKAVFVFEKQERNSAWKNEYEANLKADVKIPVVVDVSAHVGIGGKNKDDSDTSNIYTKFYGDFTPIEVPENFEDAKQFVYKQMPTAAEENNQIVIEYALMPLDKYCDNYVGSLRAITHLKMTSMLVLLENISKANRRVETLLSHRVASKFPSVSEPIIKIKENLARMESEIQEKLKFILPKIRSGDLNENELQSLEAEYANTSSQINLFLTQREREIKTIDIFTEKANRAENIIVVDIKEANGNQCLATRRYQAVHKVPILPSEDVVTAFFQNDYEENDDAQEWFNNPEAVSTEARNIDAFVTNARNNVNNGSLCFLLEFTRYVHNDIAPRTFLQENGVEIESGPLSESNIPIEGQIAVTASCSGTTVSGTPGSIKSPNYPSNYNDKQSCTWKLIAPTGKRITLSFLAFELENLALRIPCGHDSLTIYDGQSASDRQIAKLCGSRGSNVNVIESSGKALFLKFTTDNSVTKSGFRISYETTEEKLKEGTATIVFSAQGLKRHDAVGWSDPYFKMYMENANGGWTLAYKSEYISDNHNPQWKPFSVPIVNADYQRRVKVRVYDYDHPDADDEIGEFIAPMRQLKAVTAFPLTSPGTIRVERFYVVP